MLLDRCEIRDKGIIESCDVETLDDPRTIANARARKKRALVRHIRTLDLTGYTYHVVHSSVERPMVANGCAYVRAWIMLHAETDFS